MLGDQLAGSASAVRSARSALINHCPARTTDPVAAEESGTPIRRSVSTSTTSRRATSETTSGSSVTSSSALARSTAAPRRRSGGGIGSRTRAPQTCRLPGSRNSVRSPNRRGSGRSRVRRTSSPSSGRQWTLTECAPTCSIGWVGSRSTSPLVTRTSRTSVQWKAPGVVSVRVTSRAATSPVRLSATRATPDMESTFSSNDSMPRTRTVPSPVLNVSPRATVPAGRVPVTTVPAPLMVNRRSIHSRTSASGSAAGRPCTSSTSRVRSSSRPAPVRLLTGTTGDPRNDVCCSSASARAAAGAGSARSLRVTATTACRTRRASSAARCSAACGIHGSSAATTNSTAGTGPTPASIVEMKRSWPGTSTNARSPTSGSDVHA